MNELQKHHQSPVVRDNRFLDVPKEQQGCSLMLILLNRPMKRDHVLELWHRSKYVVCADGAANRLFTVFSEEQERDKYIPNVILGDLDSIKGYVKEYYTERGCKIALAHDQDYTDMQKCIFHVLDWQT